MTRNDPRKNPRIFYGEKHDRHMSTFNASYLAQIYSAESAKDGLANSKSNLPYEQVEKYQDFARERLGFEFTNPNLLITALTHRSYVNEHRKSHAEHNERLEYLGDAVLELVTSNFLYRNYFMPEGVMTAVRAALVRTESIRDAGRALGYEPLIRLSKGEKAGSERARASIIADCFEALLGAVYLDRSYDSASEIVHEHILSRIDEVINDESWRDAKSLLQELSQHIYGVLPSYKTIGTSGPDHERVFTIAVVLGEIRYGLAEGRSKQDAQTEAARQAIDRLKKEGLYVPVKFEPIKQNAE